MGKRGPKPRSVISTRWSPQLAYAIGLLASDGCMSYPSNLVDLTSRDVEQLENYKKCLGISVMIGTKPGGNAYKGKKYSRVQFKNVMFYNFLTSVGLTPRKSKTIGALKIPTELFWDFLRGSFDGDGTSYSYWDKRWKSSFMFYTEFISASKVHIDWIREEIYNRIGVKGHITGGVKSSVYQLKFAKNDSLKVLNKMYHSPDVICLSRKRLKIEKILSIVGESL